MGCRWKLLYWFDVHSYGVGWWLLLRYWWRTRGLGEIIYHELPEYLAQDLKGGQ